MARTLDQSKPHESTPSQVRWWRITAKDLTHEDLHVSEPVTADGQRLQRLDHIWAATHPR